MRELPDYTMAKQALSGADAIASPSQSHGLLAGLFCSGKMMNITAEDWARSSAADPQQTPSSLEILKSLFEVTYQTLEEMDFSFQLLLPEDDAPLTCRAQELGGWCSGFMQGLQMGQVDLRQAYSEDCQEALAHLADIGQLDYETVSISDSDETAYVNIVEYVRLAVLVIYVEIAKKNTPPKIDDVMTAIH